MKMLVKVTKEILERSKMCGKQAGLSVSQNCAVALAVREIFPDAAVNGFTILSEVGRIPIPPDASEFVYTFDGTQPEKRPDLPEFSFEIEVPQEVIDKIGTEEVTRILSESKTLELVH